MIEYKDIEFYNDFCRHLDEFTLLEQFVEQDDMFVGRIWANNPYHELVIEVEIPKSFPHNKCCFYTNSLYGYPHLIFNPFAGKSWFCLNTPFEETAEEQLLAEFRRLRAWIKNHLRPELDANINDPDIIQSLRLFNAYANENRDEIKEIESKSELTFIGDFAKDPSKFKESGNLHCLLRRSERLFAYEKKFEGTVQVPYIIVDKEPKEKDDFVKLRNEFFWDDDMCASLLPGLGVKDKEEVDRLFVFDKNPFEEGTDNWHEYNNSMDYWREEILAEWHYFAIGFNCNESLRWILFSTNLNMKKGSWQGYIMNNYNWTLKELIKWKLNYSGATCISEEEYFGRGHISKKFAEKHIGIIGLGAIGSIIAENLARGGSKFIELWDSDIVEPGNLCRSSYSREHIGEHKLEAMSNRITTISPFCSITKHGYWIGRAEYDGYDYHGGDLYGRINYKSQVEVLAEIQNCDLLIDCTASNELLHFLSFADIKKPVISLCITNKAKDLILVSNKDGNPFELRKAYLSKISQDTQNYFVEGTGCYSPTFMATASDVQSLATLALRYINNELNAKENVNSCIWSYHEDSIISNRIRLYAVENTDIQVYIDSETLEKATQLPVYSDGSIGFLLGTYSRDGLQVMISHIIAAGNAVERVKTIFEETHGIIDYLGDFVISKETDDNANVEVMNNLVRKVQNPEVNICNPIFAELMLDGTISLKLYINNEFVQCHPIE